MCTGQPMDDPKDYSLSVWAGKLPLKLTAGISVADLQLASGIELKFLKISLIIIEKRKVNSLSFVKSNC